jgi:hypothetical protein
MSPADGGHARSLDSGLSRRNPVLWPPGSAHIRQIAFAVEDIDAVVAGLRARGAELVGALERYEDSYRLCYVRGQTESSSS